MRTNPHTCVKPSHLSPCMRKSGDLQLDGLLNNVHLFHVYYISCVKGKLVEVNEELLSNPTLLLQKVCHLEILSAIHHHCSVFFLVVNRAAPSVQGCHKVLK